MIDKRELQKKAREKKLNLSIIEKDYVLGWLLYGFTESKLIFKGGTALSKIFFPKIWRLSEDLDYSFTGKFETIDLEKNLEKAGKKSKIKFWIKNKHQNPGYLQIRIQYQSMMGKNWAKIDITHEKVFHPEKRQVPRIYSDYPEFTVRVMKLEEIFAEKLRSSVERRKSRDYYDIYRMLSLDLDKKETRQLFRKKCETRGIQTTTIKDILPPDLKETLKPYWKRELPRLVSDVPKLDEVLTKLKENLTFLEETK